ncbi:MAG TPA: sodium-extruding oxaloacetate decarboxylase subunit alpha [Dehalococcoidales bacterium]|nr:sodium-extruding oxaloacetate decarboxylase subunit alpha [Dehalococcoidales bacterium]
MAVKIIDTTLRDAHQSLIATRMRTRDMLPLAAAMDKVGFFSLEVWGGATFDTCIRFLNEDPWERLRAIREKAPNTKLQMLLRGQNLVGYRHYSDDVVQEFIRLSVKNGIDVMRIFDAMNDFRNMEVSIKAAKKYGAHVQGTIAYTTSPVHSIEGFAKFAQQLEQAGSDSICIKDMAGVISPADAAALVKAIKCCIKIPLDLHTHCSSGMAPMSYFAAVEAGVDIIDTAFSAFAWGTSQPPTESMVAALQNTPYDTGLDLKLLYEIGEQAAAVSASYRHLLTAEVTRPNVNVLLHKVPGGMISNLISQLKEQNALNRLEEVWKEVPRVRAELGYPPLVTPTSQLVGTQAVLNVLSGGRYKKVTKETRDYLLGYYGKAPGEIDPDIQKMVIGDSTPITQRPADLLAPEVDKIREEVKKMGLLRKEEDVLTYALYPQVALKFLRGEAKEESIKPAPVVAAPQPSETSAAVFPNEFTVDVDGEVFNVKITSVLGTAVEVEKPRNTKKEVAKGSIVSPMSGMVLSIKVKIGEKVKEGDLVAVIEAMKMQNEIHSTLNGVVKSIMTFEGEVVSTGNVLVVVEPDVK